MDVCLLDEYLETIPESVQSIPDLHTLIQTYFSNIREKIIPELCVGRKYWHHMKKITPSTSPDYSHICNQLKKVKQKIQILETQENQYYRKNATILFSFFESRKSSSHQASTPSDNHRMLQFFAKKTELKPTLNTSLPNCSSLVNQDLYLQNIYNRIPDIKPYIIPYNKCICGNGELIPYEEDGVMICNFKNCGNMVNYVASNMSAADGKDPPNEISYSSYTRLVHFKEIIAQTQGRSTTHISTEIVEKIRERIRRERITDLDKLTINKMREILRSLNLTDTFFDHVQYLRKLMGVHIPSIPENLQNIYCSMFLEVQRPWDIHKPEERHNFSNCGYLLYQFSVLTNQTQYLSHIHLLQRDKLEEHDIIFERVCKDLGWKYSPIPK